MKPRAAVKRPPLSQYEQVKSQVFRGAVSGSEETMKHDEWHKEEKIWKKEPRRPSPVLIAVICRFLWAAQTSPVPLRQSGAARIRVLKGTTPRKDARPEGNQTQA